MQQTKIEYLTHTWNPIAMRCTPVSEGCANCWHLRMAKRLQSVFENYSDSNHNYGWRDIDCEKAEAYAGGDPYINTKELSAPFKLRKPAVIGVQFMGDLFHESIPFEWIDKVLHSIANSNHHQFVILTKRLTRANEYFERTSTLGLGPNGDGNEKCEKWLGLVAYKWPIENLIIGTSVENQRTADERILKLLQIPAWKRMVSYEPALEEVDFRNLPFGKFGNRILDSFTAGTGSSSPWNVNILVAGAETGPGARPCDPDWLRSARDQCAAAGVPFFLKQVDAKGTRELDGQRHDEWIWKVECK